MNISPEISKKVVSKYVGREPWSSGSGRRLMFIMTWVKIPALYTGWTFFTFICCKNCHVFFKDKNNNGKEVGDG